jgi:hypothetical protein
MWNENLMKVTKNDPKEDGLWSGDEAAYRVLGFGFGFRVDVFEA